MRPRFPSVPVLAAGLVVTLLSGCAFFEGDDSPPAVQAPSSPGLLSRLAPMPGPAPQASAAETLAPQAKSPAARTAVTRDADGQGA
ncbi:hypothetical protein [Azospirillum sp. B4]|uniref:hypothetical protein n=1 Tax=Azospirillum sp. B4 TaxID=95605 RepID=UPI0011DCA2F8|nr:hypothetical protein [Azospirillum sp. B4]